jgi:inner membrane protein
MKIPVIGRGLAIAAVAVAILVPIGMISGKIAERQARAQTVSAQFAAETSGPQLVAGPLLAAACEESFKEERQVMRAGKAETVTETRTMACPTGYFVPRIFKADISMPVEARHRGIYSIRMYRAEVGLSAEFGWPEPPAPNGINPRRWTHVYVGFLVRDPRGIKSISGPASPGPIAPRDAQALSQFTVTQYLGTYDSRSPGAAMAFTNNLTLVGTSSLHVAPVGDRSEIRMRSDWPHPSFGEAWSPDERKIGPEGFEATWRLTHLATGGHAAWTKLASESQLPSARGAGVALFDPVNVYALSYRATEYAFLFVLFTFAALALTELLAGIQLHPMQYALVGSALAVFFLLLLAASEHTRFDLAYASAAAACVSLLTFYLRHPLGTAKRTAGFFAMFVVLYDALYVLLKSEDHALLLGSLLVFLTLAVAMIATRKVDWAALSARLAGASERPAT